MAKKKTIQPLVQAPQEDTRTVYDKSEGGYYQNKLDYGSPIATRKQLEKLGFAISILLDSDLPDKSAISNAVNSIMAEVSPLLRKLDQIEADRIAYQHETSRLNDLFRSDLIKQEGTQHNPYESDIFALAWDRGHSDGHSEVANAYTSLAYAFKWPPTSLDEAAAKQIMEVIAKQNTPKW